MGTRFTVVVDGKRYPVEVSDELEVSVGDRVFRTAVHMECGRYRVRVGRRSFTFALEGRTLSLRGKPQDVRFEGFFRASGAAARASDAEAALGTIVRAPMPGRVIAVMVRMGDTVALGTPLLVLEAMKMQNEIPSPAEGVVKEVKVSPGSAVGKDDPLVLIA